MVSVKCSSSIVLCRRDSVRVIATSKKKIREIIIKLQGIDHKTCDLQTAVDYVNASVATG